MKIHKYVLYFIILFYLHATGHPRSSPRPLRRGHAREVRRLRRVAARKVQPDASAAVMTKRYDASAASTPGGYDLPAAAAPGRYDTVLLCINVKLHAVSYIMTWVI